MTKKFIQNKEGRRFNMKKFDITIVQRDEYYQEFEIEADTLEEAEEKAWEIIGDHDLSLDKHSFQGSEKHIEESSLCLD